MLLTKAQRKAVYRVHQRIVASAKENGEPVPSYRQTRRTVQGTFFMDECVMLPFGRMWLGIERDGYTHS